MAIEIHRDHKIVARSQNLRGIRDYASREARKLGRFAAPHVTLVVIADRALTINWSDGAQCNTLFGSAGVLRRWVGSMGFSRGAEIQLWNGSGYNQVTREQLRKGGAS
jgi:hypothetical protein